MKESLLAYYQRTKFNPVPISIEEKAVWDMHVQKRRNLYERHLGIPLSLLRGKSVIEFGCNSGENAAVLASAGANLTLVEPNEQVLPRLHSLFDQLGLSRQIHRLINAGIDKFHTDEKFDVVIAEGFLYTLDDKEQMFRKVLRMIAPGGVGAMSFVDYYGSLFEFIKKATLWHACRLAAVDPFGPASLQLAKRCFEPEFKKINASRSFEVWWQDMLLNPTTVIGDSWSYPELLKIIEEEECVFLSSSPKWSLVENYQWYKNVRQPKELHKDVLNHWKSSFPYMLTGRAPSGVMPPAKDSVISTVYTLVKKLSDYASILPIPKRAIPPAYPKALSDYLTSLGQPVLKKMNGELKTFFHALSETDLDRFIAAYRSLSLVRSTWGTVYHYLSYVRS